MRYPWNIKSKSVWSLGAEVVLPQKAFDWQVGVGMRVVCWCWICPFFLSFFENFFKFLMVYFLCLYVFSPTSLFSPVSPYCGLQGLGPKGGILSRPIHSHCTWTSHIHAQTFPMHCKRVKEITHERVQATPTVKVGGVQVFWGVGLVRAGLSLAMVHVVEVLILKPFFSTLWVILANIMAFLLLFGRSQVTEPYRQCRKN